MKNLVLNLSKIASVENSVDEFMEFATPHELGEDMVPSWTTYYVNQIYSKIILQVVENAKKQEGFVNVIFNGPPSHSKTHYSGKVLPIWLLNNMPWSHGLMATHTERQSQKSTVFCRNTIEANQQKLRVKLQPGQKLKSEFWTTDGGMYRASGVGGAIQGDHYDWGIVDDVYKDRQQAMSEVYNEFLWDWHSDTFRTRINPNGMMIWTITRWHSQDILGRLLKRAKEDPNADQYWHIVLPALSEEDPDHDYWMDPKTQDVTQVEKGELAPREVQNPQKVLDFLGRTEPGQALIPERYNEEALKRIKASVTKQTWHSLYQGRPLDDYGRMFKEDYFIKIYLDARREYFWFINDKGHRELIDAGEIRYFLFCDSALKAGKDNDYTVIACVGLTRKNHIIVFDVWRDQVPGFKVYDEIINMRRKHPAVRKVFIEDQGSGSIAIQIGKEKGFPMEALKPDRNKELRAEPLEIKYQNGEVYHFCGYEDANGSLSPEPTWLNTYTSELIDFPFGSHDDQVDAVGYCADSMLKEALRIETYGLLTNISDVVKALNSPHQKIPKRYSQTRYATGARDEDPRFG